MYSKRTNTYIATILSACLFFCMILTPIGSFAGTKAREGIKNAESASSTQSIIDGAIKEFNSNSILRVPGLNNLTKDATPEQLDEIMVLAVSEVEKKIDAEKRGITVTVSEMGRFRAAYHDDNCEQSASISGNHFLFTAKDGSYSAETSASIIFDVKTDVTAIRNEDKCISGSENAKEVASYSIKIAEPGYMADRYTTTMRFFTHGKLLWNGYVSTEYKRDGTWFAKKMAARIEGSVVEHLFNIDVEGDTLTFTAKKPGKQDFQFEYVNGWEETVNNETIESREKKVDAAISIIDELPPFRIDGLNNIAQDEPDNEINKICKNIETQVAKAVDAEKNELIVKLLPGYKFRSATKNENASLLNLNFEVSTKDSIVSKKSKKTNTAFNTKSNIWCEEIKDKRILGSDKTKESLTFKFYFDGPATDNYTSTYRISEGDGCLFNGHCGIEYKMDVTKFLKKLEGYMNSDSNLNKYYKAETNLETDELTITAVENGKFDTKFEFFNQHETVTNTIDEVSETIKNFRKEIPDYSKYSRTPAVKEARERAKVILNSARKVNEIPRLKEKAHNIIKKAVREAKLIDIDAKERVLDSPKSVLESKSNVFVSAKVFSGKNSKLKITKAKESSRNTLRKELSKLKAKEIVMFDVSIDDFYEGKVLLNFNVGKENAAKPYTVLHINKEGKIETFPGIKASANGILAFNVDTLSPFIVASGDGELKEKQPEEKEESNIEEPVKPENKPSKPNEKTKKGIKWVKDNSGNWIVKVDGKQQKGWFKDTVKYPGWYYFDKKTGIMKTGWLFDKQYNAWYYFAKSGKMSTGWTKVGSTWYYMNSGGSMKTGWFFDKSSKAWYYLKSSGAMSKGWEKVNGKWYYMNSSGKMMTGKVKISNKFYYFNSKGVWVR